MFTALDGIVENSAGIYDDFFVLFICRFSFEENSEMTGSPELSMVLEKAIVLLNGNEFSALRRILAEYEATEINIDTFADSLLQLIKDQEKVGVLTNGKLI